MSHSERPHLAAAGAQDDKQGTPRNEVWEGICVQHPNTRRQ